MPVVSAVADIATLLRCPRCRGELAWSGADAQCVGGGCSLSARPFLNVGGKPILVDFDRSILDEASFRDRAAASPIRRPGALSLFIRRIERSDNATARRLSRELPARLPKHAKLLVIGGGTIGSGAESLYANDGIDVVGTDIYASANIAVVADGHHLPFADGSFDAVWIQAVLEHVLNPDEVVAEIHRVLKPGGYVVADMPFMQQLHEGPYDLSRFTVSGHRWLFRRFSCIEAGATSGVGTALLWSIRYFTRAVTGSDKLARVSTWPFLWLRLFDGRGRHQQDGACVVYFFGQKAEQALRPSEMVDFYLRQKEAAAVA